MATLPDESVGATTITIVTTEVYNYIETLLLPIFLLEGMLRAVPCSCVGQRGEGVLQVWLAAENPIFFVPWDELGEIRLVEEPGVDLDEA